MKNKCIVLKILLLIFVVSLIVCSYNVIFILSSYNRDTFIYNNLATSVISTEENFVETVTPETAVDFEKLKQMNPHIQGWLYNSVTGVNYPVVQGKDNDYYLKHLFNGETSSFGTLFFDYRHSKNNNHFIIYGHNMHNGAMFGSLQKYSKQENYDQNPMFYFYSPNGVYKLNIISSYYTQDTDYTYNIDEQLDISEYVEYIKKKSCIKTNADYKEGNCIITLSTCAYLPNNNRFVVHCAVEELNT